MSAAWAAFVTVVIVWTERDGTAHVAARGALACGFSLMIVYTFTAGARAAIEIDTVEHRLRSSESQRGAGANDNCTSNSVGVGARATGIENTASDSGTSARFLFAVAFWSFIFGVLAWIADILHCGELQALPM